MEDLSQQSLDRFASVASPGDRAVELRNLTAQPLSPKDERVVSANPSPDAAISGVSRNAKDHLATSQTSGALTTMYPFNSYAPQEQGFYFGGYDNGRGNWDEHTNYLNANNLQLLPPGLYNDNTSLFFPPGYGFDSQIAYGHFSPLASPLSPIMFDGQLFSPHHLPVTPPYYPPPVSPGPPHVTSALLASQTELMASGSSSQENLIDHAFFGSSRSSSLDTSRLMSPLTSGNVYSQPIGILGSYEQNVAQAPFQGFGQTSKSPLRHYLHGGPYQINVGSNSFQNQLATEKVGRHERNRDSVSIATETLGIYSDRNRGPRASRTKVKSSPEEGSSSGINDAESTSAVQVNHFNSPDFMSNYESAKFFVIKSFSEDNIHKSIKYSVWASTPLGNRKLDSAYREANLKSICPVFLLFSVNASGQFCGVAEMVGPVDFENDANYWQQDRWSGQFHVIWHIIKDVPNSRFRHILLENNDNKPVTHSRDSQEVKLEQGIEMLKIFKNHDSETSLLDDFNFYDEREISLLERKAKQRASLTGNTAATLGIESINQLSDNLADTLCLGVGNNLSKTELK